MLPAPPDMSRPRYLMAIRERPAHGVLLAFSRSREFFICTQKRTSNSSRHINAVSSSGAVLPAIRESAQGGSARWLAIRP